MATTRPNVGINIEGSGPSEKSIAALSNAIIQILEVGNDREERLAALDVLAVGSTGGVSITGCDVRMGEKP
jgi:hypothetical protein